MGEVKKVVCSDKFIRISFPISKTKQKTTEYCGYEHKTLGKIHNLFSFFFISLKTNHILAVILRSPQSKGKKENEYYGYLFRSNQYPEPSGCSERPKWSRQAADVFAH